MKAPDPTSRAFYWAGLGALAGITLTLLGVLAVQALQTQRRPAVTSAARVSTPSPAPSDPAELGNESATGAVVNSSETRNSCEPKSEDDNMTRVPMTWQDTGLEPAFVLDQTGALTARPQRAPAGKASGLPAAPPTAAAVQRAAPRKSDVDAGRGPIIEREPEPVICGLVTCREGEVCCNESCSICAAPGAYCKSAKCRMHYPGLGELCGGRTCAAGDACCCGSCVDPGEDCDPDRCSYPDGLTLTVPCGPMHTCRAGRVCCNPSCGTCTAPGETCDQSFCPSGSR